MLGVGRSAGARERSDCLASKGGVCSGNIDGEMCGSRGTLSIDGECRGSATERLRIGLSPIKLGAGAGAGAGVGGIGDRPDDGIGIAAGSLCSARTCSPSSLPSSPLSLSSSLLPLPIFILGADDGDRNLGTRTLARVARSRGELSQYLGAHSPEDLRLWRLDPRRDMGAAGHSSKDLRSWRLGLRQLDLLPEVGDPSPYQSPRADVLLPARQLIRPRKSNSGSDAWRTGTIKNKSTSRRCVRRTKLAGKEAAHRLAGIVDRIGNHGRRLGRVQVLPLLPHSLHRGRLHPDEIGLQAVADFAHGVGWQRVAAAESKVLRGQWRGCVAVSVCDCRGRRNTPSNVLVDEVDGQRKEREDGQERAYPARRKVHV